MEENNGQFIVVYDWMRKLNLTRMQTDVFALVYGFTRGGRDWNGNYETMATRLNCNHSRVSDALNTLTQKRLLKKTLIRKQGFKKDYSFITTISQQEIDVLLKQIQTESKKDTEPFLVEPLNNKENNKSQSTGLIVEDGDTKTVEQKSTNSIIYKGSILTEKEVDALFLDGNYTYF